MKNATFVELDAEQAEANGFATWNKRGRHVCVELPQDYSTVSIRTPDGQKITFGFVPRVDGDGHQVCDIVHHSDIKDENGNPLQQVAFLGVLPLP